MNKGENAFFDPEIRKALDWLISIRDQDECGWAWVPLIAPNIQNTSEVICASVDLIDFLKENEKDTIIESINITTCYSIYRLELGAISTRKSKIMRDAML